jgi:hypothetical protein
VRPEPPLPLLSHRTLPPSLTPLRNAGDTSFDRCPCIPAAMRWCAHIIATLFLSLTSQKNAALVLSLLPKYSNRDLNPPSHPFSPKVPDKPFHGPLYGNRCVWPGVPPTPSRVASYSAHLILPPVRRCPQIRDVPPASLAIVLGSCIMLVPARCPPLYLARCPILPSVLLLNATYSPSRHSTPSCYFVARPLAAVSFCFLTHLCTATNA